MLALKAVSKGHVVVSGLREQVMSEKNAQRMCDSAFIVKLYETYSSAEHLYFLLELARGGDLFANYNFHGLWGNEECAQFYIAGTALALEHLHARKIVFRDVKPENLLLTEKGWLKLTDFGFAKVLTSGMTHTLCGTPQYSAPELLDPLQRGHSHAVDWWSLGVLAFELMSGVWPFDSDSGTKMDIYVKVLNGIDAVDFGLLPEDLVALVKGLCNSDPAKRLPMKEGGIQHIKTQTWFTGFEWSQLESLSMSPPYVPAAESMKDITNFSRLPTPPQIPYKDDEDPDSGWDKDFATSE